MKSKDFLLADLDPGVTLFLGLLDLLVMGAVGGRRLAFLVEPILNLVGGEFFLYLICSCYFRWLGEGRYFITF